MKLQAILLLLVFNIFVTINLFSQNLPDSLKSKLDGKSKKEQVSYLSKIAKDNLRKSPGTAYSLAKIANDIAFKSGNKNDELNTSFLSGKAARFSGHSSEAISYFNKAIAILVAANHKQGLASAYNELGLAYKESHKFNDAVSSFKKSASYFEELNDKKNAYLIYNNLGAVYIKLNKQKKALDVFTKVKDIAEEMGNKKEIATSYNQLGVAYANYGNTTKALNFFNKAKDIASSINMQSLVASIQSNIDNLQTNITNKENLKTTFEQEQAQQQQGIVSSLQNENLSVKQQNLKSFAEIEKLSFENQAKELRLHVIQSQYDKQVLENKVKEQDLKLLEAENKQKKAEISRKNEAIAYQKKVLLIVGVALGIVIVLLLFIIRLYVLNKRTLKIVRKQKTQIENQKNEIEVINKELSYQNIIIRESIDYAKHIQFALLPSVSLVQQSIPNFFVFLKPRDVVSGDFYWYYKNDSITILSAIDCTGHGVPGALMSMIANSLLNNIIKVNHIFNPAKILESLNNNVLEMLAQSGEDFDNGMDITMCSIDTDSNQLVISMAGHTCTIVQDNEIKELDGQDFVIGGVFANPDSTYENHVIQMVQGMTIYFYSDGFSDQMGGEKDKKFGRKAFSELLKTVSKQEIAKQSKSLETTFDDWKGEKKQIDDILVMGFTM